MRCFSSKTAQQFTITIDKQVKSNSSVKLFLEVYYYKRIASHVSTRNIAYGNQIFTIFKINEFDQFY